MSRLATRIEQQLLEEEQDAALVEALRASADPRATAALADREARAPAAEELKHRLRDRRRAATGRRRRG